MATTTELNTPTHNSSNQPFFEQYKTLILGCVGGLFLILALFGFFRAQNEKNNKEYSSLIFNFENGPWKEFEGKKIDAKKIAADFRDLTTKIGAFSGALPLTVKLIDTLNDREAYSEAMEIALYGKNSFTGNNYSSFFILSRLAVIHENMGNDDKAIEVLLKIQGSSLKLLDGKTYLDLGRLYLKKGDKEKARRNLKYVLEKSKQDDLKKLANFYLQDL